MATFNQQNQQVTNQVNVGGDATFGAAPNSDSPPAETPQPSAPLPSVSGHADVGQVSGGSVYGTYIGVMNVHNAPSPGVEPATYAAPPPAATADATRPPRLFISYAHADSKKRDELLLHLKPLLRNETFAEWNDTQIMAGEQWSDEIETALNAADAGILLVTPAFLASDFIFKRELPALLHKKIFWVLVSPSNWQETALSHYQAAYDPSRPLAKMTKANRDEAWVAICRTIKAALRRP